MKNKISGFDAVVLVVSFFITIPCLVKEAITGFFEPNFSDKAVTKSVFEVVVFSVFIFFTILLFSKFEN